MSGIKDKSASYFLDNMPGLTGAIAQIIHSRLEYEQPGLAMGAALSFVATLKSRRIVSPTGIAPNLYTCVIALSGTGKTQAQNVINEICNLANCKNILLGVPASDAGLIDALYDNPRRLLMWDEMGVSLSALAKKNSASYETSLLGTMLKMFSASNSEYLPKVLSKNNPAARTDSIKSPCLNIFGASTPSRFYGALNEDFTKDGFLPRILLFLGEDKIKGKNPKPLKITQKLIDYVEKCNQGTPGVGDIGSIIGHTIETADFSEIAQYVESWRQECKSRRDSSDEMADSFISRLFEQTIKLSLILSDNLLVDLETFMYARLLAEYLVYGAIDACKTHLFHDERERKTSDATKKILDFIIKKGGVVSKTILNRQFSRIAETRDKVISELAATETIRISADGQRGGVIYSITNS